MGLLFGGFVREGPRLFHLYESFHHEGVFSLLFLFWARGGFLPFVSSVFSFTCVLLRGTFSFLSVYWIFGGGGHGRLLNTWSLLSYFLFSPYLLAALVGLGFTSLVYKYCALPQKDSGLLKCSIRRAMISRVLGCMLSYCCFWSMG
ncbi:hypothetical protein HOY82DRAFT_552020 [Tuber indicum]|nr:hypothetical protein HOY82DRAFT_552020 [Tuber indicum]